VNLLLLLAGVLGIIAAGVHGAGGELLVVRRLSPGMLAPSPFGGPVMTKAMIHVTWHITTAAFFTLGLGLLLSGCVLHGDVGRGIGLIAAAGFTGFAAIALGFGAAHTRSVRSLLHHPGPAVLALTAALAWAGVLP
jgi:hypothetical protein